MPLAVIVPTVELPPLTLSTDHVTDVFEKPWSVAVNCWVPDEVTEADAGVRESSPTVTEALALADVSATLVAVTLCVPAVAGAVYRPVEPTVPTVELPPAVPSTAHVTAVLLEPVTVAVNWVVEPTPTFTEL